MKYQKLCALLTGTALILGLLTGCGETAASAQTAESAGIAMEAASSVQEPAPSVEPSAEPAAEILLSGDRITAPKGAKVSGSVVTVTESGTYLVSGTLDDGQILVDAGKNGQVTLVLSGASITCSTSAPIYIKQAGEVVIELAEGTENAVTDGAAYVFEAGQDEPDAAIFSKDDLVFRGSGSLTVQGNFDKAIHGKDNVTVSGGTYVLTAVDDGLKGKDSVTITDGDLTVTAGGDGIQANNDTEKGDITITGGTVTVAAGGDGIQAEHSLSISGGTISVTAGEDGLQAKNTIGGGELEISGGCVTVDAQEDGLQSDGDLRILDGTLDILTRGGADEAPAHMGDFFGGPPGWFNDVSTDDEEVSAKGIKSAYDITIAGGSITINSYDDAVHADGSVTLSGQALDLSIRSGDDGVHANETLSIQQGRIQVAQSYEGLEALFIDISGGEIEVHASDDGMNANGDELFGPGWGGQSGVGDTLENANTYLHISGGTIYVDADGDGLDSNGLLLVEGGETRVCGPASSMNGALDSGTAALVHGGSLIAIGASGMDELFDGDSRQPSFRCVFNTKLSSDSAITLRDSDGNVLLEFTPDRADKTFNSVVLSLPELTVGETYTLTCGDETVEIELTDQATSVRQTQAGSPETQAGFGGFGGGRGGPPGFGG